MGTLTHERDRRWCLGGCIAGGPRVVKTLVQFHFGSLLLLLGLILVYFGVFWCILVYFAVFVCIFY